ncbi:MAG: zinc ribbon domain-containing protein [Methanoregula sp.]|nr:zinc ribbon domain-containing protein [Methanoregula sp.]
MQNPASPPKVTRTCPHCNTPVRPGYKFCETCGTKIPELSTCSKCGTQFITPLKYCELCGAPVVLEVGPAPDEAPEFSEEEAGPVEEEIPEQDEEETPEPEELPAGDDDLIPEEAETPRHHRQEIREPDTEELLEKYGKEYDVNETLDSSRKPKSRSPEKPDAKKPARDRAPRERVSSGTVDEALFLAPGKTTAPARRWTGRTGIIGGCIVLVAIIAAVYFIGLPVLTSTGETGTSGNPVAVTPTPGPTVAKTVTPTRTVTPAPAKALVPLPTQTPAGQKLYFQVQKSPITAKILVTFAGSAGHGSIRSADVRVTHPDGSVASGMILPLKGITEIILDGSKETDRVEIIAQMSDGESYRIYDELVSMMD